MKTGFDNQSKKTVIKFSYFGNSLLKGKWEWYYWGGKGVTA